MAEPAWITRTSEPHIQSILREGDVVCLSDIIESDSKTVVVVEHFIGGQAVIKPGTQVESIGRREFKTVGNPFLVRAGTIWAKVDKQNSPFRIKTAGGSLGRSDG